MIGWPHESRASTRGARGSRDQGARARCAALVIRALAARHLDLGVLPRRAEASGAASHDGVFLDVKENRRGRFGRSPREQP
ncbi:hypothetical protein predicted by Glimmer/Critica [Sorangium cellulosum So ce56]|uniref:Uncharacterized protein n=1 Tax=Sorangium cellulosum (strain So ce56) TaxID=448385 RepID=A9EYR3_SORC5|nr:hypothetical protein predicted by Glimmer/Critica [Sorangium cellulosum So ce56]